MLSPWRGVKHLWRLTLVLELPVCTLGFGTCVTEGRGAAGRAARGSWSGRKDFPGRVGWESLVIWGKRDLREVGRGAGRRER